MQGLKKWWAGFSEKHPKLSKWLYQIAFFIIFSEGVTIFQYLVFTFVMIGGGLGYFLSMLTGSFLAQCINFPLQRNITFKSHGNPAWQAMWYFIAWIIITPIVNSLNCVWVGVMQGVVPDWLYNIGSTFIMGGISMIVFFFVFKIIFPEGEAKKEPAEAK